MEVNLNYESQSLSESLHMSDAQFQSYKDKVALKAKELLNTQQKPAYVAKWLLETFSQEELLLATMQNIGNLSRQLAENDCDCEFCKPDKGNDENPLRSLLEAMQGPKKQKKKKTSKTAQKFLKLVKKMVKKGEELPFPGGVIRASRIPFPDDSQIKMEDLGNLSEIIKQANEGKPFFETLMDLTKTQEPNSNIEDIANNSVDSKEE